jgi:hypothetical protein
MWLPAQMPSVVDGIKTKAPGFVFSEPFTYTLGDDGEAQKDAVDVGSGITGWLSYVMFYNQNPAFFGHRMAVRHNSADPARV